MVEIRISIISSKALPTEQRCCLNKHFYVFFIRACYAQLDYIEGIIFTEFGNNPTFFNSKKWYTDTIH